MGASPGCYHIRMRLMLAALSCSFINLERFTHYLRKQNLRETHWLVLIIKAFSLVMLESKVSLKEQTLKQKSNLCCFYIRKAEYVKLQCGETDFTLLLFILGLTSGIQEHGS